MLLETSFSHPNGGFEVYVPNMVHEDSNINNNSSDYGGGIYLSKVGATISNTMLQLNTSTFGGGIYQTESTTTLMDASVYQTLPIQVLEYLCTTIHMVPKRIHGLWRKYL